MDDNSRLCNVLLIKNMDIANIIHGLVDIRQKDDVNGQRKDIVLVMGSL